MSLSSTSGSRSPSPNTPSPSPEFEAQASLSLQTLLDRPYWYDPWTASLKTEDKDMDMLGHEDMLELDDLIQHSAYEE
jgi:hypothetical protein